MECHLCRSTNLSRVPRKGFLRKHLLARLGFYPWRCRICGYVSLFRQRHRDKEEQGAGINTAQRL